MYNTKLQVPINSKVLSQSKKVASSMGFSSINEVVRIFLNNFSKEKIDIFFQNEISPQRILELQQMSDETIQEYKKGKVKGFSNVDDLIEALDE